MFLIDPVLQVIERKQYRYRDFDNFEVKSICEILAMRNRMIFIYDSPAVRPIALVPEIGPDLVTRHLALYLSGALV